MGAYFPLGYKEAAQQWVSFYSLHSFAEQAFLSLSPFRLERRTGRCWPDRDRAANLSCPSRPVDQRFRPDR